jgi:tRNA (guanine-N7-)-methyltransferase
MVESEHPRAIRSFVIRAGRVTAAQQRALAELWPRYGIEFGRQLLDLDALFGRRAPRVLEIGFGNGEHLLEHAMRHPDQDHLGIEVHPPGVGRLLLGVEGAGLINVRVSAHDAVEVLEAQIADATLDEVLILFPDPWHKKRHHKRRLIQPPFAASLARCLKPGARLHLETDWEPYAEHMLQVLDGCAALENAAGSGTWHVRAAGMPSDERVTTRFERRGERLGHRVFELTYRRR